MGNGFNKSSLEVDEIDLREIITILLESKKLIISTILFFSIASIIYSLSLKPSFNTSAKFEIGYYEMPDGTQKLIENSSNLISDLKILILKNPNDKFSQNISMNSFEKKIINLETTSSSAEQNENILNELIKYIDERHSNLTVLTTNQKKNKIFNKINLIESEISFIKAKQLDNKQLSQSIIEAKIARLENELPIINLEISQLEKVIIDDTNNLSLLKENDKLLVERAANSPTLEQIIFTYKTQINSLIRKKSSNSQETKNLNNQLKSLDTLQSDQLFSLEKEKAFLENELRMLMNQTQVKTHLIGGIKTEEIKPKTQLITTFGIFIGFFASILLVLINNFIKNYRES